MSISENLTQQKLLDILMNIYVKGNENKNLEVKDIIDDLTSQLVEVIHSKE